MNPDRFYTEFEKRELRRASRLDPSQFGRCPVCQLPPSEAYRFPPLTWAVCDLCQVRWCCGDVLDPPEGGQEVVEWHLEALAEYQTALPITRRPAQSPVGHTVGDVNTMKTKTQKLEFERPVSIAELTANLDRYSCYPALAAIEQEFAAAERRLEAGRATVLERDARVEQLGREAARNGDNVAFEAAHNAAQTARALLPSFEEAYQRARRALDAALDTARDATLAEASRRQQVINRAAAPLLAALAELEALEQALRDKTATLPQRPGEGLYSLGSCRNQPLGAGAR